MLKRTFATLTMVVLVLRTAGSAGAPPPIPAVEVLYNDALAKETAVRTALKGDPEPTVLKAVRTVIDQYEAVVRHYPASGYSDARVKPVFAGIGRAAAALMDRRDRPGVRLFNDFFAPKLPAAKQTRNQGNGPTSFHQDFITFAVDRSRLFIGSFNFDPRSAHLNTEMGLVIDSPRLGARLSDQLDRALPRDAYEVRLRGGGLEWIEGDTRHASEPNTGFFRRTWIGFLSILPIEWLL